MGTNRSVYIQYGQDDTLSSLSDGAGTPGLKRHFQRDDFRSAWSHNNNGDGVAAGKMITDITGNGFVYVDSHLAFTADPCFRYAYRDMNKNSDIACSVILNTAIDSSFFNATAPYQGAGIIMKDVETGGIIAWVLEGRPFGAGPATEDNYAILSVQKWTNESTFLSNHLSAKIKVSGPVSLLAQRRDSLTDFKYSLTGVDYVSFTTIDNVSAGTPYINTNRLGFGYYNKSGTTDRGQENAASFGWVDLHPAT